MCAHSVVNMQTTSWYLSVALPCLCLVILPVCQTLPLGGNHGNRQPRISTGKYVYNSITDSQLLEKHSTHKLQDSEFTGGSSHDVGERRSLFQGQVKLLGRKSSVNEAEHSEKHSSEGGIYNTRPVTSLSGRVREETSQIFHPTHTLHDQKADVLQVFSKIRQSETPQIPQKSNTEHSQPVAPPLHTHDVRQDNTETIAQDVNTHRSTVHLPYRANLLTNTADSDRTLTRKSKVSRVLDSDSNKNSQNPHGLEIAVSSAPHSEALQQGVASDKNPHPSHSMPRMVVTIASTLAALISMSMLVAIVKCCCRKKRRDSVDSKDPGGDGKSDDSVTKGDQREGQGEGLDDSTVPLV